MRRKVPATLKSDDVGEDDASPAGLPQHNATSRQTNNQANQRYSLRTLIMFPPKMHPS
jgi:hypothetical protein